jgi:hypothetical protein
LKALETAVSAKVTQSAQKFVGEVALVREAQREVAVVSLRDRSGVVSGWIVRIAGMLAAVPIAIER